MDEKKFEILLSCMGEGDMTILDKSNIKTSALVINQCDEEKEEQRHAHGHIQRMIFTQERGLSRSRNMALRESDADFCLLADNDERFADDVEHTVIQAFEETGADIVAFELLGYEKKLSSKSIQLSKFQTLKIASWQIAFRRKSILNAGLSFDVRLGAGTNNGGGEENKFLWLAHKRGLKIWYCPNIIATMQPAESTWFSGFTEDYFRKRGAVTRNYMGAFWSLAYGFYFLFTKRELYKESCRTGKAAKALLSGFFHGIGAGKSDARIFFVGDFRSDNGPGIANKTMMRGFQPDDCVRFSMCRGKAARIVEMTLGSLWANHVCLCSSSRSNVFCIRLCAVLHRDVTYLMHGYLTYEAKINGEEMIKTRDYEQFVFGNVRKVICVSPGCAEYMKTAEPEYRDKFVGIYNAVGDRTFQLLKRADIDRPGAGNNKSTVISLGGGMPLKNNLVVCRAIEKLNARGNKLQYIVIGLPFGQSGLLKGYDFVEYYEKLPNEEVLRLLTSAELYVQNSTFETFGIAPLEALGEGCSVLMSRNLGVLSVFDELPEEYLINNVDDEEEIATKIEYLLQRPNHRDMVGRLKLELIRKENVARMLKAAIMWME